MTPLRVAAVDLGATSGRVMAGTVRVGGGVDRLELVEVHRFPNGAVPIGDSLVWDIVGIHREVLAGLRAVARSGPLHGIGIDSWAVDYALVDRDGRMLGNAHSYRDRRTEGVAERVRASVPAESLYALTGLQQLPFNTIYQLVSMLGSAALDAAETMLLLPDLLGYWLTGEVGAERTNASTTGLYAVESRTWAEDLAARVGIAPGILPPLREAGAVIGHLLPDVASTLGLGPDVPVIAVGSHDTASAVVAVPAVAGEAFAFISSGTWSLVGLELDAPVLTEAARVADFTNEGGVDGTIRFLRNVMGLWVLSECRRAWQEAGGSADLQALLAGAAAAPALRTVIDINDPLLLVPSTASDPMRDRVAALARRAGEPVPQDETALTRCVLDSLALAYRRNVRIASELAGRAVGVVHVVGGGSQNELLCQLTADACGLPVLAGPAEAAALGNVLVQARSLGTDLPDLPAMRALVRRTQSLRRFEPDDRLDWDAAESRLHRDLGGGR